MSTTMRPSSQADLLDGGVARAAGRGALWGGISTVLWVLLGIDSIVRPVQDNRREIFWWFPYLFMMLTIIGAHRVQGRRELRLERYCYWVVMFAWILVFIGNLGLVFNIPALLPLGFPGGAIVGAVGLIVYGVATWRARVLPWYAGLGFMLWEPGSIATGLLLAPISPLRERGSYSAGIWKGFAIGLVALGLHAVSKRLDRQGRDSASI
jgi:hypothetical protein